MSMAKITTLIPIAALAFLVYQQYPVWKNSFEQIGQKVSVYSFSNLEGENIEPNAEKRIYMFWTTWCGPCHVQMKIFDAAIKKGLFSAENFYAISLGEDSSVVKRFAQNNPLNFPLYVDSIGLARHRFSIYATPSIIFVNEKNEIERFSSGLSPLSAFQANNFLSQNIKD